MSLRLIGVTLTLLSAQRVQGQAPAAKTDSFEAASVRVSAPVTGFHFGGSSSSGVGGPGSSDPETFRCSGCTLATLIAQAYHLEKYQLPAQASLTGATYDVSAKIREGATQEEFRVMLQNLLKERFGLVSHFEEKSVRGYHLVVAKGGPKLKESSDSVQPAVAAVPSPGQDQHGWAGGQGAASHSHIGVMNFNGQARFHADHQRVSDLAELISTQLLAPVDDQTGLGGKYDIALNWAADAAPDHFHADGASGGHEHGGASGGDAGGDSSAPPLATALQLQLGLKLVAAEKTAAQVLIVDHVEKKPTEN
jgi:uncharacterized protein (TIGR03435 family)